MCEMWITLIGKKGKPKVTPSDRKKEPRVLDGRTVLMKRKFYEESDLFEPITCAKASGGCFKELS